MQNSQSEKASITSQGRTALSMERHLTKSCGRGYNRSTNLSREIADITSTTPYSGDIVKGIQDWAEANGRSVILANTNGDLERELQTWQMFQAHRIEGVLFVAMYHRVAAPKRGNVDIPTVLVNCRSKNTNDFDSIEPDDFQGSAEITKYLLGLGHRRIGYIKLNSLLYDAELHVKAFKQIAREAGLAESNLIVRQGMEGPIGAENNHVYREAIEMLSLAKRPTAIMCGNDEVALQVYLAALAHGLRIPEDLSIVGFDDFKLVSNALKPELTTVALPYYELGNLGAQRLAKLLDGNSTQAETLKLNCPVVIRGSSAKPLDIAETALSRRA